MEYEHKGVKILLDQKNGNFDVAFGTRVRTFPSLASAKKAIDAHADEAFEPFDALCEPSYNRKVKAGDSPWYVIHKVIGIERVKGRKGWGNRDKYIFENNVHHDTHSVLRDTPENRAALVALREFEKESSRIKAEREREHDKLRKAVKYDELGY